MLAVAIKHEDTAADSKPVSHMIAQLDTDATNVAPLVARLVAIDPRFTLKGNGDDVQIAIVIQVDV